MRQDQLCIQMIRLMDHVLKRENLDLRLTPYRVLATSSREGLLEFVDAQPLSRVLGSFRTINKCLASRFPDSRGHDGVRASVSSTETAVSLNKLLVPNDIHIRFCFLTVCFISYKKNHIGSREFRPFVCGILRHHVYSRSRRSPLG